MKFFGYHYKRSKLSKSIMFQKKVLLYQHQNMINWLFLNKIDNIFLAKENFRNQVKLARIDKLNIGDFQFCQQVIGVWIFDGCETAVSCNCPERNNSTSKNNFICRNLISKSCYIIQSFIYKIFIDCIHVDGLITYDQIGYLRFKNEG